MWYEDFKLEIEKLKIEYPEFFAAIPHSLLELVTSEKFSTDVARICWENGIRDEERVGKVAYRVVLALFGEVPKENLAQILNLGAEIDLEIAKKLSVEFNRVIFSQLKESKKEPSLLPTEEIPQTKEIPEKEDKEIPKRDIYREPIE